MPFKYPSLRTTLPIAGYHARLDAGAAATDQFTADGSQDGTLTNGATRAGSPLAYSFDGVNDFIDIGDQASLNFGTGNFTIAAWIKTTTTTRRSIINKFRYNGTAAVEQGWLFDVLSTGLLRTAINTIGAPFPSYRVRDSSIAVNTGALVHIAFVRTGVTSFPDVYVNGVLRNGATLTNGTVASVSNTQSCEIGREWDQEAQGLVAHFVGDIDDVVIYGTALSATDIGYLATQLGAVYAITSAGRLINGTSLVRPAGTADHSSLIIGAT